MIPPVSLISPSYSTTPHRVNHFQCLPVESPSTWHPSRDRQANDLVRSGTDMIDTPLNCETVPLRRFRVRVKIRLTSSMAVLHFLEDLIARQIR
jgi:hypothetical protein